MPRCARIALRQAAAAAAAACETAAVPFSAPRPLAEVPPAAWRAIEGVLTDVDDTLTAGGAVEPAAAAALRALADAGVPVIAITGRPAAWSEALLLAQPLAAVVAENGGVLLQPDGRGGVRLAFADDEPTRRAQAQRLRACAEAIRREVPGSAPARDSAARLTDIAIDHGEHARLAPAQVDAVVAVMRRHGLHASVSSIHVNGWLGRHTKWTGAAWAVRSATGRELDPRRWAAVGDSANDEPLFTQVPLSVGVANVAPWLPKMRTPPAYLAPSPRGRGFAEVAAALIGGRG